MEFETCNIPKERNYVDEFLQSLNDHPEEDKTTAYKIVCKLSDWEQLDFGSLLKAEHIKKVEGKLFEVRVKIKGDCYRFLGIIKGHTFLLLHAIKKKRQKLPRKDIELAKYRSKLIT
ncbi:TPA: hypothetical protein DEP58_04540 [Patescibacteria group bacterium]|nr:MAG: hypothetical protein UU98_C0003G0009 [Parcubacteria group bacterium GW2011_GWD2_42_14]HCC05535.1 hypothetical protein [Patescibacteria group bacterium]